MNDFMICQVNAKNIVLGNRNVCPVLRQPRDRYDTRLALESGRAILTLRFLRLGPELLSVTSLIYYVLYVSESLNAAHIWSTWLQRITVCEGQHCFKSAYSNCRSLPEYDFK
jgi:hypothetical protein